jgi:hypothetical protein
MQHVFLQFLAGSWVPSTIHHSMVLSTIHHLPAGIYGFFGGGKNIKFYIPATTEQKNAGVNLFRKPSDSSILMAIDAIDAIFSDQVNP